MDNVEEMDKFLEKYNFPKLDQAQLQSHSHQDSMVLAQRQKYKGS